MSMKKFSLVMLVCFAAFSYAPICSASPKGRHASGNLLAQPIVARDWNFSFPITQAPPPDPSSTVPDGSPTQTCQTYDPCNLFYQVSRKALLHLSRLTKWSSMCPFSTGRATRRIRRAWLHWPVLQPQLLPLDSLCTFSSLCPVITNLIIIVEYPRAYTRSSHLLWLVTAVAKSAKVTALSPHHLPQVNCRL